MPYPRLRVGRSGTRRTRRQSRWGAQRPPLARGTRPRRERRTAEENSKVGPWERNARTRPSLAAPGLLAGSGNWRAPQSYRSRPALPSPRIRLEADASSHISPTRTAGLVRRRARQTNQTSSINYQSDHRRLWLRRSLPNGGANLRRRQAKSCTAWGLQGRCCRWAAHRGAEYQRTWCVRRG